jgi:multicomponent Na+:H+ antiporter subunit D
MLRLWQKSFWGYPAIPDVSVSPLASRERQWLTIAPVTFLLALSLAIGIFSDPIFHWSELAAAQVLDRAGYIATVAPTDVIEYVGKNGEGVGGDHE